MENNLSTLYKIDLHKNILKNKICKRPIHTAPGAFTVAHVSSALLAAGSHVIATLPRLGQPSTGALAAQYFLTSTAGFSTGPPWSACRCTAWLVEHLPQLDQCVSGLNLKMSKINRGPRCTYKVGWATTEHWRILALQGGNNSTEYC